MGHSYGAEPSIWCGEPRRPRHSQCPPWVRTRLNHSSFTWTSAPAARKIWRSSGVSDLYRLAAKPREGMSKSEPLQARGMVGTGPCFSLPDKAGRSARSERDLLMGLEGAPMPPERSCCVHEPAGAAPRPASTFASRSALQVDEVCGTLIKRPPRTPTISILSTSGWT
jgi:hypothetical protein